MITEAAKNGVTNRHSHGDKKGKKGKKQHDKAKGKAQAEEYVKEGSSLSLSLSNILNLWPSMEKCFSRCMP